MVCKKCGAQLPEGAKYCSACKENIEPTKKKSEFIFSDFFSAIKTDIKPAFALIGSEWKRLLRWLYQRLSGMEPEQEPSLFDVFAALKDYVVQLSGKQRMLFFTGSAAVLLVLVCLVGSAVTPNQNNSGGGGSWTIIGGREHYQPEFSKLDCLTCRGDGDCNTCGGYGEVERYAGAGDTVTAKCSSCYGSGNCRTCGGSGKR